MAIVYLNEELKVEINTFEEAAVLRGFLVECKYKDIRIGRLYLKSEYESQKKALLRDKKTYEVICNGYSVGEEVSIPEEPVYVPVAPVYVPVAPVYVPVQEQVPVPAQTQVSVQVEAPSPIPVPGKEYVDITMERKTTSKVVTQDFYSDKKMCIDVDRVLQQLGEICLDQNELGCFVAVDWNEVIRTEFDGDIVELKFKDENGGLYWEEDKLVGEWVRFRGDLCNQLSADDYWIDNICERRYEWYADFSCDETGGGYSLKIQFEGDNGYLDVDVRYKTYDYEYDENSIDPDILEDMILGGCWD